MRRITTARLVLFTVCGLVTAALGVSEQGHSVQDHSNNDGVLSHSEQGARAPHHANEHTVNEQVLAIEEPLFVQDYGDFAIAVTQDGLFILEGLGHECLTIAKEACEDGICWIRIIIKGDGTQTCEFACRDSEGNCSPMPDVNGTEQAWWRPFWFWPPPYGERSKGTTEG
jgi:hypothetical protein